MMSSYDVIFAEPLNNELCHSLCFYNFAVNDITSKQFFKGGRSYITNLLIIIPGLDDDYVLVICRITIRVPFVSGQSVETFILVYSLFLCWYKEQHTHK